MPDCGKGSCGSSLAASAEPWHAQSNQLNNHIQLARLRHTIHACHQCPLSTSIIDVSPTQTASRPATHACGAIVLFSSERQVRGCMPANLDLQCSCTGIEGLFILLTTKLTQRRRRRRSRRRRRRRRSRRRRRRRRSRRRRRRRRSRSRRSSTGRQSAWASFPGKGPPTCRANRGSTGHGITATTTACEGT